MIRHPAGLSSSLAQVERTLVMGVLNVTPDSFSDGGCYLDPAAAVAHGLAMVAEGADLVDVGGESTRPGADPVTPSEELRRVVAVVRDLAEAGVAVSIDTRHAEVARACVEVGALLVNDVSGGRGDPAMWRYLSSVEIPYVLMHNRGSGASRDDLAAYSSPDDVWRELLQRRAEACALIPAERLVLDPGIGFAKDATMNWRLLADLDAAASGRASGPQRWPSGPVLLGVSRKRFLATHPDGTPRSGDSMAQRDRLTAAITERAVRAGVWCVRVHDVAPNARIVRALDETGTITS